MYITLVAACVRAAPGVRVAIGRRRRPKYDLSSGETARWGGPHLGLSQRCGRPHLGPTRGITRVQLPPPGDCEVMPGV